ncbi:hypothetical protein [Mesorhizobium mediterraneum]|uniref:hypothetical protein n=1 Tax=Mesorhizobium mediterraneum TaxID=43617 RepID=UPI00177AA122|nr:hypothetical protein [Mesorhizobium mediterraneum]
MTMFRPDIPAKCCAYCGGRDHDYENCPKWKADAEQQKDQRVDPAPSPAWRIDKPDKTAA